MATTSDIADSIGVKYETLRNWIKKGLLASSAPAGGAGRKRKWRDYSDTDRTLLVLTRRSLSAGVPLDVIVDICNDRELVAYIDAMESSRAAHSADLFVIVWYTAPEAQFMLVSEAQLTSELKRFPVPATLLNVSDAHTEAASSRPEAAV